MAFARRWAPRLLTPLLGLSFIGPVLPSAAAAAPLPAPAAAFTGATFGKASSAAPGAASVVLASAIVPGSVNRTSLKLTATYAVTASLAVDTGVLRVSTTITARNDSGAGIDRVELETVAARLGAISITSASVDGQSRSVTVNDQTLVVPLGGVLPDGATVQVKVTYRATLRNSLTGSNWLFTRYGGTISMYRWIPWVSAPRPFDRPNHGDPFVTPSSPQVDVTLTLDKARILAAPIARLPKTASKSWVVSVKNVRDVNLVLAPDFSVTTTIVDGVTIRAYSRPGGISGATLANQAALALHREAVRLGVPYAWTSLTVVETAAGGYGMESPRMVWIPSNTLSGNLTYLVHHEVAHQWFYGLVGNDQQREPFADEAAADLLARTVLGTLRSSRCSSDDLDRRITQYTAACYYETIYIQGGNTLNLLRSKMGTALFWHTVAKYVTDYSHKLGGTKLLLDRLRAASPVDLGPTLRSRFPSLY